MSNGGSHRLDDDALPDGFANRLHQFKLAADFGRFALSTHDISALLQEATRACAEGLRSKFCKVLEYLPAEDEFFIVAGVGWRPGIVGVARVGADLASPTGFAFKTGEAVISNRLAADARFRTPKICVEHGIEAAINVLIRGSDPPFGILEVDSSHIEHFTAEDTAFLQGFADLLGVAIERHRLEEELSKQKQLLEQALTEQKLLAQEIDHRVKNSLALVAGLLSMQSRAAQHPEMKRALDDAEARVHTIAEVHNRLWQRGNRQVRLDEFIGDLCQRFSEVGPQHQLTWQVAPVLISADRAVTLGLLANELITNVYKYAYADGGPLSLDITPHDGNRLCLEVVDHGVGLPEAGPSNGLGMKVISSLARQLNGTAKWESANPGTRFTLSFVP